MQALITNNSDRKRLRRLILGSFLLLLTGGAILLGSGILPPIEAHQGSLHAAWFITPFMGVGAYQIGRYTEQDRMLPSCEASTLFSLIVLIPVVLLARAAKTFYSYTVEPSGFSAFGYVCIVYLVMISVFLSLGLFMRQYARKRENVA